jgi:hypothetical protein
MKIGILDPALLLPRPGEEDQLEADLDEVARICRDGNVVLPTFEEYWPALWKELGSALHRSLSSPRARRALDELRGLGRPPRGMPPFSIAPTGRVYGLRQMFEIQGLGPGWLAKMTAVLTRAWVSDSPTILLTRRIDGRNSTIHSAENWKLDEITRWVLYLHLGGTPPRTVYCFHHSRNLSEDLRWTTRYDWRLPASSDGATHPFCPPAAWRKRAVRAVATVESKKAFLDAKGNGWARPNIEGGKGYHWDVYIRDAALAEHVGLGQLNIVEFGAPPKEGAPGTIHHIPAKKKAHLRDDTGWTC